MRVKVPEKISILVGNICGSIPPALRPTRLPPPPLGVVMAEIEKGNAFMVITQMDLKQTEKQEQQQS